MSRVTIIDYGINNIKSVERGIEEIGFQPLLSSDPDIIFKSDRLILPGVGAFENGMSELSKTSGLIDSIKEFSRSGKPMIAICLGMQMLLDLSYENGNFDGLGLIPGKVMPIPSSDDPIHVRKIPHVQWNSLIMSKKECWDNTYLNNIQIHDYFYFVHSYMAVTDNKADTIAYSEYEGIKLPAVIRKDNITGFQFHPEKSANAGLKILKNFMLDDQIKL